MILKMQGNDDTRQIGKLEIDIIDVNERKCFVCSLLVFSIKNKNFHKIASTKSIKACPNKGSYILMII